MKHPIIPTFPTARLPLVAWAIILRVNLYMHAALIRCYRWQQQALRDAGEPASPRIADRIAELDCEMVRMEMELRFL